MSSSQHYYRTLLGLFQSRSRSALKRGLDQARKALESDEGQFKRICAKLLRDVRCPVPHHQKARRQDFTKRVFAVMGAAGIKTWLDEEGSPEPAQPSPAAEQCQVLLIPDHMALLTDIPSVAIKFKPQDPANPDVNFMVNTSSLHNEILGHRLSMVPVCTPDVDTYQRDDYRFVINAQNKGQETLLVTTDDIRVYLSDGTLAPPEVQRQLFPLDPITRDPILITKLKPNIYNKESGEALHVEFWASVGTAQENALWSPVSLAAFSYVVDEDAAAVALAAHLEQFKLQNPDASEDDVRDCQADFAALTRGRHFHRDAAGGPSRFRFSVESSCGLTCIELVRRTWVVLRSHLQKLLAAFQDRVRVEVQPNNVTLVYIDGAKHTHGCILQGYMHRHAQRLGVQFAGYHVPHPLEERQQKMAKSLKRAEDLYFNGQGEGDPTTLDDETYDALKDISAIKRGRVSGREGSAAGPVGAPPREGSSSKVQLPVWMGSLDKPRNMDAWLEEDATPIVIMDKLDGVSGLVVADQKGKPARVLTRGNGSVGEDVSFMLSYVHNLPSARMPAGSLVRGEFVISRTDFAALLAADPSLKNARATVSGVINSRRSRKEDVLRRVQFVAYELLKPCATWGTEAQLPKSEQLKLLGVLGFTTVWSQVAPMAQRAALEARLEARMQEGAFDIDGLVLARDISDAPAPRDGNPDHIVAFKMNTLLEHAESTVLGVTWKQSKDRLLKPTIRVEPVNISGVVIKRLTGFNAKYIVDNKIGPGARVQVVRSGLVIPYINAVLAPAPEAAQPHVAYEWNSTGVDMVAAEKDDDAHITELQHFLAKLGVAGVGPGSVRKLYAAGFNTFEALLGLRPDDVAALPGFGSVSAAKLVDAIRGAAAAADTATWVIATNWLGRGYGDKKLRALMAVHPQLAGMEEAHVAAVGGFSKASAAVVAPRLREFAARLSALKQAAGLGA
ncbi:hypothetical protein HXX76_014054 [Chlamydomonas incerta]|uniref:DNA ligase (NAD(+)) n=1 Tax=Chlamydomonas incerta TaxID=51695 RepID=A0A835SS40_CHLIN|nr:hypothetical protein HXX76_014054 [Chlamydomonas incerta]|eukprot:KAG2424896.1 hypothetical protein HXX76_014054 [Chlamydomonas incerta]